MAKAPVQGDGCAKELAEVMRAAAQRIKVQSGRLGESEADTRCVLIEPVLSALGWNTMDTSQVQREYHKVDARRRGGRKLDYVLFVEGAPCALIEAKKLGQFKQAEGDIRDVYCRGTKDIGVATDGLTWSVWKNGSFTEIRIDASGACRELSGQMSRASITGYVDGQVRKEIEALIEKFNATHTEDDLKKDEKSRRDTNMAVQLFSRFVVANKNRFRNDKDFHQMQRAYLNILQYADGKKMVIGEVLDSFDGLDPGIKDRIKSLSREGKYVGIARTLRRKNAHYRTKFLDLIEAFTADHPYDVLLGKFKRFRGGTRGGGAAALTGILSSLQPEHFMAYNTRSSLPLADTVYRDLANVDLNRYERFNRIYRNIHKTTGKSLVALDIIANGRYLDNSD